MEGPLHGVKVLDLSRFIAGPSCAQVLADFGAEVVKIERPGGEDARHHEPFYEGESVYTMLYNRNKYGATLDTRHPKALPVLESLVRWADVVVENYRPGTMDKMGLGYERLTELKPGIIMVSISGFGQTGPLAKRALFDAIAQASSGLMSVTGEETGSPTLTGTYIADYVTGYQAAIGTFAALMHKMRTGEGQRVDVASLDSMFATLGTRLISWLMLGADLPRSGSRDLLTAPVNVYECADGDTYIQAGTNSLFPKLCRAIGRADLLETAEYATVPGRMANAELLEKAVADWARPLTCEQVAAVLEEAGIPFAKVATVPEVAASPQIAARDMVVESEHPALGTIRMPGNPVKMDRSPPTVRKAPPLVGEDNDHVYGTILGMTPEQVRELGEDGAI
ncbi:CaiB/BaiF CoA-transferase family protein [Amycolatopsis endophytica]|uniref:Crotonobetainyl-CoA:carnitine CoA-transferase CaiB-like acyl-CoA transferase n=1 Tax=Amycolatopsis endophytica TaxID=860233 RepID=A0A853BB60_9PSEU|nr:CoA transferase [Amycolatopsis endophytica]NYI92409.1 crotonobetainyl-CoA:carnitine CoA-transferase CaiB-like acyl-CoA transferase [Amycolatopsis endophytica]